MPTLEKYEIQQHINVSSKKQFQQTQLQTQQAKRLWNTKARRIQHCADLN